MVQVSQPRRRIPSPVIKMQGSERKGTDRSGDLARWWDSGGLTPGVHGNDRQPHTPQWASGTNGDTLRLTDLTHLRDCCSKAYSLCQVFSQLPNRTVYFLVHWPSSFSSKNHWRNTVTSRSLDLCPLVAWCEGYVLFDPLPWLLLSSLWMRYYRVPLRCAIPHKFPPHLSSCASGPSHVRPHT